MKPYLTEMKPYLTAATIALGLLMTWATLVQLAA